MRRSLELNIRLFYVYRFLRDAQVWIPVWVVFLTVQQGFSLAEVTAADGLFFLAIVLFEMPTGAVADRWGRGLSVGLGCLVMVMALAAFAFATTFSLLLTSFLLWALAAALMSGADLALLYDSLQALGREEEYERHAGRGEAAVWVGVAAATAVDGPLAVLTSIRFTIFAGMGVYLLAATVAFLMVEAPHRAPAGVVTRYFRNITLAVRIAWRDRALRWLVAFGGHQRRDGRRDVLRAAAAPRPRRRGGPRVLVASGRGVARWRPRGVHARFRPPLGPLAGAVADREGLPAAFATLARRSRSGRSSSARCGCAPTARQLLRLPAPS